MSKKLVVGLIFVVFLSSVAGVFFTYSQFARPTSADTTEMVFEVEPGKPFLRVAQELEQLGLVSNSTLFSLYARVQGEASKMKVGEYALRRNMSPKEILAVITSGKSIGRSFVVAEGLNIFEIAELYEEQGFGKRSDFLTNCRDPEFVLQLLGERHDSLEGYLFPETYQLTKYTSTRELLRNMVAKFQEVYASTVPVSAMMGMTKHQIVTLASLIEKETGAPEERPNISSVFHNRLKKGMMLQTDPTILYSMALDSGEMVLKISKADITRPHRYNTYTMRGLPPGPISNPGKEAMAAAIRPAQTDFLFFVSNNDGTSTFSKDLSNHNRAVQKTQLDPNARKGKSWRDRLKKPAEKTN